MHDTVLLTVPVLNNFQGFTELMHSVDYPVKPFVIDNWNDNVGVAKSWNMGLTKAIQMNTPYCLITNDDVILHNATIYNLMGCIRGGKIFITANAGSRADGFNNEPDFSCFMVNAYEFVKKYGWFDENIYPAYFEDNDMARRMLLAGDLYEKCLYATIIHKGSVTQNGAVGGVVPGHRFEELRDYYIEKWGGNPLEEVYTHPYNDESKDWKYCR